MYNQDNYWMGYSWLNPANTWNNSAAKFQLFQHHPWLLGTEADTTGLWFQNNYEALFIWNLPSTPGGFQDFAPGELAYNTGFGTSPSPQHVEHRAATRYFARGIPMPQESIAEAGPNSAFNPTSNPYGMKLRIINDELGVFPQVETEAQKAYRYLTDFSEYLVHNISGNDPRDFQFFIYYTPSLFNTATETSALVVDGAYTGPFGSPVEGHGLFGQLPNISPQNLQLRYDNMATFHDTSEWVTPLGCHTDRRCTNNGYRIAAAFANARGRIIRMSLP
jgi:hypothetical protein